MNKIRYHDKVILSKIKQKKIRFHPRLRLANPLHLCTFFSATLKQKKFSEIGKKSIHRGISTLCFFNEVERISDQ